MDRCIARGARGAALLGVLALAACGTRGSGTGEGAATRPDGAAATAPTAGGPYVDTPEACLARLPSGTTTSGVLRAGDRVLAAVTCREADRPGQPVVVRDLTPDALAAVLAALRQPSQPQRPACDASGRLLPTFALQLADGRWVHPDVPSDGCHPTDAAVQALHAAAR